MTTDDARQLRRTLRDVVALSTLPAVWVGRDSQGVAESLADVLSSTLSLDLVYIRLEEPVRVEVARGRESPELAGQAAMIGEALAPLLEKDHVDAPALVLDPLGGGMLRVVRFGLGQLQPIGWLIAGSRQPGFPTESDRLLLGIGANQGAIVIQRARAEEKVHDSERRLRELIDALPAAVYTTDAEGRLTHFNPACVEFSGRAPELGSDQWCVGWKLFHPDGRPMPHDEGPMAVALKEGRVIHGAEAVAERPDGKRIWFARYSTPLRDAGGRIVGGINMLVDITERKQAEQTSRFLADASATLAELTDYERTLQRVAALAVPAFADWCAVDMKHGDGTLRRLAVIHVDPAKVALAHELFRRYPPQPFDRHGPMKVLHTGEPEWSAPIPDFLIEEVARDADHLRIIRQLGLKSFICAPIRLRETTLGVFTFATAESGRIFNATDLAVGEDLARRAAIAIENANLLATLKEADRRKDEFLATLAHELRNPLAPVRNAVELLRLKGPDQADLRWSRDVIARQVEHLTRLIDDLLDVSRITRNKLELRMQRVELTEVISGAVESSRPAIAQCGHQLTVTLPPQPVYLNGDLVRLAQVFLNLLNNAAKYTERGGRISLTAECEGAEVVVRVKDTGVGISPEKLPGLFEMFFQVDGTLERSQGGLGIGLSLVRHLVQLHGGQVEARSDGVGKGSEFIVRLPALAGSAALAQRPERKLDGNAQTTIASRRILVVDDNRDSADSLAMLLGMMGNEVQLAYDGLEGVEAAARFRPDVVLLDIGMPKLNGHDVCRRIREESWGRNVILIALTG